MLRGFDARHRAADHHIADRHRRRIEWRIAMRPRM